MEERKRIWKEIRKFEEILFEEYNGIAKITINRPQCRNAFTPLTTQEMSEAFGMCRELQRIRVVLLTRRTRASGRRTAYPSHRAAAVVAPRPTPS